MVRLGDTYGGGTKQFPVLESEESDQFQRKPRNEDLLLEFNGIRIKSYESARYFT